MRRRIDTQLSEWKQSPHRKPLILLGARQVGKTYALRHFGKRDFKNTAYIDFSADPQAARLFDKSIHPQDLVRELEIYLHMRILPEETLIVFDEVQLCERALTSLKYFCDEAAEYHVIAAGSLLGVKVNRSTYSFPVGKVDMMTLHPMSFEEYLWAKDRADMANAIREAAKHPSEPFPLHDTAMNWVHEYMLVGGMPEAVTRFLEDDITIQPSGSGVQRDSYARARAIHQSINNAYIADMAKYASANETQKIVACWASITRQLAKENHKFQYKVVHSGGRSSNYLGPITWLVSAGIVSRVTQVTEGTAPLKLFENPDAFKIYMADTGMLATAYNAIPSDLIPTANKVSSLRGAIAENYVLQQLKAQELSPYYWGTNRQEIEFMIEDQNRDVVPIEVKSGGNVTARSLSAFRTKYQPRYSVRISAKNFGETNGIVSVPLYAAWALNALMRARSASRV